MSLNIQFKPLNSLLSRKASLSSARVLLTGEAYLNASETVTGTIRSPPCVTWSDKGNRQSEVEGEKERERGGENC